MDEIGDREAGSRESEAPTLPEVDAWLVDGFNVLHAVVLGGEARGRFWDREQRQRLIVRLATGSPPPAPGITVVFDGKRAVEGDEAHPAPGLELVFAPSADDWIVASVRAESREPTPRRLGVVTNDQQVAGRCRHSGAVVVSPAGFMASLPPDSAEQTDSPDPASSEPSPG